MSTLMRVSLAECWKASNLIKDEFTRHFWRYLCIREGYVQNVYKDSKGYPTVGIGHLVQAGDKLKLGDVISHERVGQLFAADMKRLRIFELTDVKHWDIPQKVAVGSFIWSHGYGQYVGGNTQKLITKADTTYDFFQTYLRNNWDKKSPVNQARNKMDFDLFFTNKSIGSSGTFFWLDTFRDSFYSYEHYKLAAAAAPSKEVPGGSSSSHGVAAAAFIGGLAIISMLK